MTGFVREVISDRLLEFYQTTLNGTQPVILAMQASGNGGLSKYKYEGLIEENSISDWIKQIQDRVAIKFYQSEEIPENEIDNGITVVVGHSFKNLVYSSSKDVLLLIYSPVDDSSGNVKLL